MFGENVNVQVQQLIEEREAKERQFPRELTLEELAAIDTCTE